MIVITTPTGNIGSKVLRHLAHARQRPLRIIARHPQKIPGDLLAQVEVIEGSMDDPAALPRAFRGAEAVFWCQPDAPAAADYTGAYEALAEVGRAALAEAGVGRLVAVSAAGVTPNQLAGPITALHRMEDILSQSGAACRFLRCGSFFENLLWQWEGITGEGRFVYPMAGNIPGPQVATRDIAAVASGLLASDWEDTRRMLLLGPEDLSYDQMAAALSEHLGRPVHFETMEPRAYGELMMSIGQSASAAQALVEMFAYLGTTYTPGPGADRSLTPTTLREWLKAPEAGMLP